MIYPGTTISIGGFRSGEVKKRRPSWNENEIRIVWGSQT